MPHEYVTVKDLVPNDGFKPSSLDRALLKFSREGRRVLNFWRGWDRRWVFKLMVDIDGT